MLFDFSNSFFQYLKNCNRLLGENVLNLFLVVVNEFSKDIVHFLGLGSCLGHVQGNIDFADFFSL